ncbi:unnamed protein product [Albugo candida]|uniref:Uncharacterized protein n=1 Tax=Albugo candida TaxID=65357 RepID=A0A024FV01_9STRA|nr:unnamed protein product [Albugo candida]|eukprot:CCI10950.1 unnamed protein product [Albugo candida]
MGMLGAMIGKLTHIFVDLMNPVLAASKQRTRILSLKYTYLPLSFSCKCETARSLNDIFQLSFSAVLWLLQTHECAQTVELVEIERLRQYVGDQFIRSSRTPGNFLAASEEATNSASIVDSDIPPCFLHVQLTSLPFIITTAPVNDLRSALSDAKSASLNDAKLSGESVLGLATM